MLVHIWLLASISLMRVVCRPSIPFVVHWSICCASSSSSRIVNFKGTGLSSANQSLLLKKETPLLRYATLPFSLHVHTHAHTNTHRPPQLTPPLAHEDSPGGSGGGGAGPPAWAARSALLVWCV